MENNMKPPCRIYLDDVRTPTGDNWIVVRNYDEFAIKVNEIGLENIDIISLDHDLGDTAMKEYFDNVSPNYTLNYDNIKEKTGYDAAKFLVNQFYYEFPERINMTKNEKKNGKFIFPLIYVHSHNPVGAHNICGWINNFLKNEKQPETCVRVQIPHN
jgi:hypothetical protein